ncbi:MAG: hypothetical protein AAF437_09165 [Pseudomonadota bacterium]
MASKIIPFRRPKPVSNSGQATPVERTEAMPDWAKALDVEWIFKEADRRMGKRLR